MWWFLRRAIIYSLVLLTLMECSYFSQDVNNELQLLLGTQVLCICPLETRKKGTNSSRERGCGKPAGKSMAPAEMTRSA